MRHRFVSEANKDPLELGVKDKSSSACGRPAATQPAPVQVPDNRDIPRAEPPPAGRSGGGMKAMRLSGAEIVEGDRDTPSRGWPDGEGGVKRT